MSEGRHTETEWRALVHQVYTDARPDEFVTRQDGAVFFRLVGSKDKASYRAAWFPAHSYGYVDVKR